MAQIKDLIVLGAARILNKIYASEFIGKLTGNADTATKATQDESGNNIKSSYASSISISDHTITLKNKNGASLGTVTVPDNTAGATNTSSKIFLVGATSQAANPQTYSHDTAYVGTDGCLYSNSKKVSVEGHTHEAISEDFIRGLFS